MSEDHTSEVHQVLDRLIRRQRGRLMAGLVARFGPSGLDLAEDVTQDAILDALASWSHQGIPDNPGAWLNRVARNKAIDRLRREGRETAWEETVDGTTGPTDGQVHTADIPDPELRLIVLCCDPRLSPIEQSTLTLKLAGGFTAREIASVFLAREATVGQRLARIKRKLKSTGLPFTPPMSLFDLKARLDAIYRTIYLLFSIGYAPRTGDRLILGDLCREALRLAELLVTRKATTRPDGQALAALLCFQTSRLTARINDTGGPILFKDQNRTRWDASLIRRGVRYLAKARKTERPSTYHLEAAIAAAYATAPSFETTDWPAICTLYSALEAQTHSPIVAIHACVAKAHGGARAEALQRLEELAADPMLDGYGPLHLARGEILVMVGRRPEAAAAFERAASETFSVPVQRFLQRRRQEILSVP